jgi:hypothetical protein
MDTYFHFLEDIGGRRRREFWEAHSRQVAVWRGPTAPPHLTFYLQISTNREPTSGLKNRLPLLIKRLV